MEIELAFHSYRLASIDYRLDIFSMKALILAGGFATRLWPLTERRAKPLLLLDGKTILAHILEKIPHDIEIILLTNQRFKSDFILELQKLKRGNVEIFLEDAVSDGEKLGALGAISAAIDHYDIKEDIMVLAGDNLLPELKFAPLVCRPDNAKLVVRDIEDLYVARKFGVVEIMDKVKERGGEDLRIIGFEEKPEKPKSTLVSTGFMSFGRELLPNIQTFAKKEPDALGGIFPALLKEKKEILAVDVTGDWFDVGSFDTYLEAHKKLQNKDEPRVEGRVRNSELVGSVYIGEGSLVENSVIVDSIIYPGTKLIDCRISNTIIDEDCHFEGVDLNCKLVRRNTKINGLTNN